MSLREGPCAAPGCPKPEDSYGQWKKIPPGFVGDLADGHNGCLCKRDRCREHFGLHPLQPAGKKRVAADACVAVGAAVGQGPPRPFRLRRIDQIWGVRCVPPLRAPPLHTLSSPTARGARIRNADLADMSEAERENKIVAASETLEYLVHGHWEPTEGHINGRYGAWWVDIHYLLKSGLP